MSDKVSSVVAIAPVAAPGRLGAFVPPGHDNSSGQGPAPPDRSGSLSLPNTADVVTLQSLQAQDTLQTGPGKSPTQSVSQAQAQAALYAAKAAAQAQSQAQAKSQDRQQNQQGSLQQAADTLGSYFSDIHPDVGFRVEQQSSGMVVVMVNSTDGRVLQTISGDEARQLASSLFGRSALSKQTA